MWLKQSVATTVKMGPFVDSVDGNTEETALTISQADIRISKNGGAFAQTNNAAGATHDANGIYGIPLDATDLNTLGRIKVYIHESGALPVWQDFMVVPANVWDSLFGADKLQVHADEITAGLITAAAIAADAITDAKVASDVTIASVTGAVGSVTGNVGGNVTGSVGSIATGGIVAASFAADSITAAKLAADVTTELQAGLATAAALDLVDNFLDTEIAAIITTLGAAGAGLTAVPWNASWDVEVQSEVNDALVANNLDHLLLIAVDTDFSTTVQFNSVIGHLANSSAAATFDRATDSLEAHEAVLDKLNDTMEDNGGIYRFTEDALAPGPSAAPSVAGTADSGTTTTLVDAALTEADTDYWKHSVVVFTSGTLNGQARLITAFDPANDRITFAPATTQPVDTHAYEIWPAANVELSADLRIKKNTALANFPFRMTDSNDHVSSKTGLTVTGQVSKDGGAFGALTNAVTEIGSGWYKVSFAAADLNADSVALKFTGTGADQLDVTIVTQTD